MNLSRLKPVRVIISIAAFVAIALLFLDIRDFGLRKFAGEILYFQFAPSVLLFIKTLAIGGTGFIIVLVLTAVLGRVYCSTLCPLGTFQDIIVAVTRKNKKRIRRNYRYSTPRNKLRYSILGLTVLAWALGSGLLLNALDPYSAFGRMLADLFGPIAILINNLLAFILEPMGVHSIYRISWPGPLTVSGGLALATLALVGVLSIKGGRTYCNTICPVGSLLGLISRVSFFRIKFKPEACTACGLCAKACKASCVDTKEMSVDMSRCVACFNCFTVCPTNAIRYESPKRNTQLVETSDTGNGRRRFFLSSFVWIMGASNVVARVRTITESKPTTIPVPVTPPVSPPGSISLEHFTRQCTGCQLCVSVCPSKVLAPSFLEYGLSGITQPRLNFHASHCNYDCVACLDVCPSGAILPLTVEEKRLTQMGVAKFIIENCVVYTDETNCGACSEHCPTKAVDMVPYLDVSKPGLVIPEVNEEICVGCGGCEYACPTRPFRAIYVSGNIVHQQAKKPKEKKTDFTEDTEADFPF